jgi:hypothetical protein
VHLERRFDILVDLREHVAEKDSTQRWVLVKLVCFTSSQQNLGKDMQKQRFGKKML